MAKKKENPLVEEQKATETVETNDKSVAENEIPESVTLTRDEFKQVKERIDQLEKEKESDVALLQRLQADFDNYRRRNASVVADSLDEGARNLIKSLLPVLDNLDRALDNVPEDEKTAWVEGIQLVSKQLYETLQKAGLEEIEAEGQFDPELHDAVMQEESEEKESGEITAVFQKGYKVKNRIIRHSMVKVAK